MTVEIILMLLAVMATITSFITEKVKKILDDLRFTYASNIVVLVVSVIVGGLGTVIFYLWNDYAWTTENIISIFLMVCANWLVAMGGYDKVVQAIKQIQAINQAKEKTKGV